MNVADCERLIEYNEQIEVLRQEMIKTADLFGLNHPQVLSYSRKIDETHNLILKIERENSF
ncbi:aspartyl-phosphate phosphatase Spo0E family protein [Fictibacillus sp. WQ 8-8]|uniref:aspartyl-phosphate phosphatase Spo0E family protein n=1 Tax=unclassified Fictibacillus TaxID=2644029 RepID=UPI00210E2865|nr:MULTISPECIES: aspartyl-phosphate phosphatase Spo0E family protein [unclassified Fictibacillus]MCQ6268000.1 aspartyl-phosphate phosphatase Spo0E family protein [Fictibacillus sp. WQ 8-8]MED2971233.1 aspartyl-phosphate phosphatase Spo0E family protein [Fictibacillus sp. B-59209]